MSEPVDVSIIVVAWNVRKLLEDCLRSVFEQTRGISFEVIYVDNASVDGSVEMVGKEFPDVRIVKNHENLGFIKANNQAIHISKGRYVLLLNSDTLVLDNAIAKSVQFADEHPEAAVVGCRILNPDRTLQRDCFMYPSWLNLMLMAFYLNKLFPKSRFFGRERMTWWDFNDVREVQTVCGCFSLVRKKAIDQVGVMDEDYFVYGDDPDWCCRFHTANWKILFTPDAQIIHYGGQTTKQIKSEFGLQLFGSKLLFIRKFCNAPAFYAACFFMALFCIIRLPYWLFVVLVSRNKRAAAMDYVKTYSRGSLYCLTDWTKLLMNRNEFRDKFYRCRKK
jgi:GT2 family glycosyltransferase